MGETSLENRQWSGTVFLRAVGVIDWRSVFSCVIWVKSSLDSEISGIVFEGSCVPLGWIWFLGKQGNHRESPSLCLQLPMCCSQCKVQISRFWNIIFRAPQKVEATLISSLRISSLHWSLILVGQILWVWTNAYITCICHYCFMQSSFAALKILIYIPFNAYFIVCGVNSCIYSDKTKDCACDDQNALKLFPNIHFMSINFFMPFLIFLGITGWPLNHGYSNKKWNSTVGLFCLLYLSS